MSLKKKVKKPKTKAPTDIRISEYRVTIPVYEPFAFGGSTESHHGPCWFHKQFKVLGVAVTVDKYDCFVFRNPTPRNARHTYNVADVITGGILGSGETSDMAIALAIANIATTPDLDSQMKKMGPVEKHPEITAEDAFRMLMKGDD